MGVVQVVDDIDVSSVASQEPQMSQGGGVAASPAPIEPLVTYVPADKAAESVVRNPLASQQQEAG